MAEVDSWDVLAGDEEEDASQNAYIDTLKDVILFAIDCSSTMIQPQRNVPKKKKKSKVKMEEGHEEESEASVLHSHLYGALKAAVELMKKKALFEPGDMVGILLFNTMESEHSTKKERQLKPHILTLQAIQQVGADNVQNLLTTLNEIAEDSSMLEKKFRPWGQRVPLGDVFNSCNWFLRDNAPKAATKRVFIITDEDNPHGSSAQLDRVAKQNLSDLYSLGVTVEPFFISTPSKPFNPTKHWTDILSRTQSSTSTSEEDAIEAIPSVLSGFSRLLEEMSFKEAPKRSNFHIKMTLGEGFEIGVKGYGLVVEMKRQTPRNFVDVDGELKELQGKTVWFADDGGVGEAGLEDAITGPVVYGMSLPSEQPVATDIPNEGTPTKQVQAQSQGGMQVVNAPNYYTAEEVKKLRSLGLEPGIRILGFKDADSLAFEDNIKHSWFIYPSDALYKGSTRTFNALLKTLVKKDKIALALALFRRNSPPYFYAMIPQEEVVDEDGVQEKPPGFHMVPLPYADDIRAAPVEEALRAADPLVKKAAVWIKRLKIPKGYTPDAYPNPSLGLFNTQLESMALREDFNPEEFSDRTAPQTELMLDRAGEDIAAWKEALAHDPNANTYVVQKAGTKRKAETAVDELEIREHVADGTLGKLTLDPLKSFLKAKGLPVGGKKAELMKRIEEWVAKNS